jgi:hypothetical protein
MLCSREYCTWCGGVECGIEWVVCGTHRADKSLFGGVVVSGCVHSGTITVHHEFLSVGAAST